MTPWHRASRYLLLSLQSQALNVGCRYYHFVRLMGRSASNIALEVALQTCPTVCLLGEEVMEKRMSLREITKELAEVVLEMAQFYNPIHIFQK